MIKIFETKNEQQGLLKYFLSEISKTDLKFVCYENNNYIKTTATINFNNRDIFTYSTDYKSLIETNHITGEINNYTTEKQVKSRINELKDLYEDLYKPLNDTKYVKDVTSFEW